MALIKVVKGNLNHYGEQIIKEPILKLGGKNNSMN